MSLAFYALRIIWLVWQQWSYVELWMLLIIQSERYHNIECSEFSVNRVKASCFFCKWLEISLKYPLRLVSKPPL
jgi:hypothetical protein